MLRVCVLCLNAQFRNQQTCIAVHATVSGKQVTSSVSDGKCAPEC
jgi:hypothetical protein